MIITSIIRKQHNVVWITKVDFIRTLNQALFMSDENQDTVGQTTAGADVNAGAVENTGAVAGDTTANAAEAAVGTEETSTTGAATEAQASTGGEPHDPDFPAGK